MITFYFISFIFRAIVNWEAVIIVVKAAKIQPPSQLLISGATDLSSISLMIGAGALVAITTTAAKLTSIAISSYGLIRSPLSAQVNRLVQNGLVWQITVSQLSGIMPTQNAKQQKLNQPIKQRTSSQLHCPAGTILRGLRFYTRKVTKVKLIMKRFLLSMKWIAVTPNSVETYLKRVLTRVYKITCRLIAMTARILLSFDVSAAANERFKNKESSDRLKFFFSIRRVPILASALNFRVSKSLLALLRPKKLF